MRILHISDVHIGIETCGHPATDADLAALPAHFAPGDDRTRYRGSSTRLLDFLAALDQAIALAQEADVDLVLFTGDAYKSREPSQTHQREFASRIARLAAAGIPVFLLVGNHDLPHAAYKASAVEIFDTLSVPNVTIAERLATYRVQTKSGPLNIVALPWIRRSGILTRDDVRNLPYAKIKEMLEDRLTALLRREGEQLDPAIPAILAAHCSVNNAKLGTERTMMIGEDHVLLQSNLTALPVDYIALGHIHRRQQLSDSPPMLYPGSLQRIDFGEEDHEEKGVYIIELDAARPVGKRVTELAFHPMQARAFVTVEAVVREQEDPTAKTLAAIDCAPVTGAIVRVQVQLPESLEPAFREREVRAALEARGVHHVAAITRQVERARRVRLGAVETTGKPPRDLLALYLETLPIPDARRRELLEYAGRLMAPADDAAAGPP
ncbi:MAG: exonuclease SbcCD subunit D [Dehalococcoidia bacterium]|nr:exonuclease SbcCD subunit D [Dehalococcoidia bacterium]